VHFPIALLTLYSLFELISIGQLKHLTQVFWIKFVLVTIGGIFLLITRQYGESARILVTDPNLFPLIEKHESFANITTGIYGIIATGYVFVAIKRINWKLTKAVPTFWQPIFMLGDTITSPIFVKFLALAGLVTLTVTGALGGAIVYGSMNDPFTQFIYKLFF
jgi:hypothetical protein